MAPLTWDEQGERLYETGVDHGVLYPGDDDGVAWNGLTTVTESPSGAESNPQFADNIKYLNLLSAEEFAGTIEAFTYPDEFGPCDGTAQPSAGVSVGQQSRRPFGLCYRSRLGNDVDGTDHGYKLHLVYNALASPSEKAYASINDSPEAIAFSWEFTTTPVNVSDPNLKPTALIVVDSTEVDAAALSDLEDLLYGTAGSQPRLPLPDEVLDIFGGGVVAVDMNDDDNQPTYNDVTHVVTVPAVTGVQWQINGDDVANGAQPALAVGQTAEIEAVPEAGYTLNGDTDWSFSY